MQDSHPIRYLLADGICHAFNSDDQFSAATHHQYPPHFTDIIATALASQQCIGWDSSLKGYYFTREWADLAQLAMHSTKRDGRQGEGHMKNIVSSICTHARRMWLARNGCLHDGTDSEALSPTAEAVEITYYQPLKSSTSSSRRPALLPSITA